MARGKAKRTLRGDYGKVKAGEEFTMSKKKLQSLVDKGVAELVDEEDGDEGEETTGAGITEPVDKEKKTVTVRKEKNPAAGPPNANDTDEKDPIIS